MNIIVLISLFISCVNAFFLSKRSVCNNADEVSRNIFFGYWSAAKTNDHKTDALTAIYNFWVALENSPNKQSFYYSIGDIVAYMWVGSMVQNQGFRENAMQLMTNEVKNNGMPAQIYMEYIGDDPMKSFGVVINSGGSSKLGDIQRAVKNWSCNKPYSTYTGSAVWSGKSICYLSYANRKKEENDESVGNCYYNKIKSGINPADDSKVPGEYLKAYNPNLDFSALAVGQPYCYSEGKSPDFRLLKNSNGTCATYYVKSGDTCSAISAKYSPLKVSDIESYNKNTYGWKGCSALQLNQAICVSSGNSPRPVANPKAECGPLAPGDLYMAECPNKACCSDYGFCGLTSEFCEIKDSNASPGARGCYSNCGYGTLPTRKASSFKRVAYWLDTTNALNSDVFDIDGYDIVHYSFASINSDMSISVGSGFDEFLNIGAKKIIAFGGWDFSTDPSTYQLFRTAVSSGRQTFANNLNNFMNKYNLDGFHFDWEYPSEPDIPGIPAGSKDEGKNYNELFKLLDSTKLKSIALPASYWYLKGFPLSDLDKNMDYFVLMNYDYVGQWDYGKYGTGIGCHCDRLITEQSIKMIQKSGIDTTKLYGGLANYGRSFKLANTNCKSYLCGFTGPASGATAGSITNTPGFLAISEIDKLTFSETAYNSTSKCFYGIYNGGKEWVAWMHDSDMKYTEDWYREIGLGGSALWLFNYYDQNKMNDDYYETDWDDYDFTLTGEFSINIEDEYTNSNDCKYTLDDIIGDTNDPCYKEKVVSQAVNDLDQKNQLISTILNDYNNYIKYYEAYIRSYYDAVMVSYEKWIVNEGALQVYFTYLKDESDIVITPLKRNYENETLTNITIYLKPFMSTVINGTEIKDVYTDDVLDMLTNNSTLDLRKRYDQPDVSGEPGKQDSYDTGRYGGDVHIKNCVIENKDKIAAMKNFYEYSGYNITTEALVQRKDSKKFTLEKSDFTYYFDHSTILDSRKMYPNILEHISSNNVTDIQGLINHAKYMIGKENIFKIYDILELSLPYIDIAEIANTTYVEGKKQKEKYDKAKKLEILGIVMGILGGLGFFLGPAASAVFELTIMTANLIAIQEITGTLSAEDIGLSMLGLLGPVFSGVRGDLSFVTMSAKFSRTDKLTETLGSFKAVKNVREKFYKGLC